MVWVVVTYCWLIGVIIFLGDLITVEGTYDFIGAESEHAQEDQAEQDKQQLNILAYDNRHPSLQNGYIITQLLAKEKT